MALFRISVYTRNHDDNGGGHYIEGQWHLELQGGGNSIMEVSII